MKSRRSVRALGVGAVTAALLLLAGCAHNGSASSADTSAPQPGLGAGSTTIPFGASAPASGAGSAVHSSPAASATPAADTVLQPQVIRTGTVTVKVHKPIVSVFNQASTEVAGLGGFVSSSTTNFSSSDPSANLVLRVPSARFGALVEEIDQLGQVKSQQLLGQDVTSQIVNIAARIANLQSEEQALRQLMARTGSIPDILEVENQLFAVEQQIEELTAQQSSLASQVSYASLTVELTASAVPSPAKHKPKPQNAVVHGATLAVHNTAAALHGLALAIGAAFPAIVLGAVAVVGLLVFRRRKSGRHGGSPRPAAPDPIV